MIETTEIERVSDAVRELARRDVSGASKGELLEAHEAVARLERVVGALASRFAGEIARRSGPDAPGGDLARGEGFGNAGKMISKVRGGTVPGARRSIDAGGAFVPKPPAMGEGADALDLSGAAAPPAPKYPVVAEASLAGDLSVDAAGLIVSGLNSVEDKVAAADLQETERRLVAKAKTLAAHEVRKMVARAVARAD